MQLGFEWKGSKVRISKYNNKEDGIDEKSMLAVVLAFVMLGCGFGAGTVFASAEEVGEEVEITYEELLNKIHDEVSADPATTDGVSDYSIHEAIDLYNNEVDSTIDSSVLPSILPDWNSIPREKQHYILMATGFSRDQISLNALAGILYEGNQAEEIANGNDSMRHFIWNYRCVNNVLVSEEETRIFTANYEWADALYTIWESYYTNRYNYYRSNNDEESAREAAEGDAIDYIVPFKKALEVECRNSCDVFLKTFHTRNSSDASQWTKSNFMDWHNNMVGRKYASKGYGNSGYMQAYEAACNESNLLEDRVLVREELVSGSYSHEIWYSTNYWYSGQESITPQYTCYYQSKDGNTHYQICNTCGYVLSEISHRWKYFDVDSSGHDKICSICHYTEKEIHDPVYTATGAVCSKCGRTGVMSNIINMLRNGEITLEELSLLGFSSEYLLKVLNYLE